MAKRKDSAFAWLFKNLDAAQIQMNYFFFFKFILSQTLKKIALETKT